jgi:hypothetical protein
MLNSVLAAVALSQGQGPISTDRPDFTEGARSVIKGSLQFEGGVTATDGDVWQLPEALLRYGVGGGAELRFGLPLYVSMPGASGLADPSLGFKLELNEPGPTELALIAQATFAAGDREVRSERTTPALAVAWSHGDFGGMLASEFPGGPAALRNTLVFSRDLSATVGGFIEHVLDFSASSSPSHVAHFGLTRALGADAQLDLHFGFRLSGPAPDWFVGAGYSVRW